MTLIIFPKQNKTLYIRKITKKKNYKKLTYEILKNE